MDVLADVAKFNAQTVGRDKLCRLMQYSSKFVWWYLQKTKKSEELIQTIKNLEYAISTTRKLMRFGKSLDFIQASLKSLHHTDVVYRVTITLSKISLGLYLLYDHAIWLCRVGFLKNFNQKKLNETSTKFWLVSIILGMTRDFYEIVTILNQEYRARERRKLRSQYTNGVSNETFVTRPAITHSELLHKFCIENKPLVLDTLKNGTDVFLPMATLGYIDLSPGFLGVCGMISSIIGIFTVWNSSYKLVPS